MLIGIEDIQEKHCEYISKKKARIVYFNTISNFFLSVKSRVKIIRVAVQFFSANLSHCKWEVSKDISIADIIIFAKWNSIIISPAVA